VQEGEAIAMGIFLTRMSCIWWLLAILLIVYESMKDGGFDGRNVKIIVLFCSLCSVIGAIALARLVP
jgi:hypothetical protein